MTACIFVDVICLFGAFLQYNAAAVTLHSIGGVEFLSGLRQDLTDAELLQKVDSVLNNLFWVHVNEDLEEDHCCQYNKQEENQIPTENGVLHCFLCILNSVE